MNSKTWHHFLLFMDTKFVSMDYVDGLKVPLFWFILSPLFHVSSFPQICDNHGYWLILKSVTSRGKKKKPTIAVCVWEGITERYPEPLSNWNGLLHSSK